MAGGAGWAVGLRLASQGIQFALGIVLARVLAPADFGLAASIYAITGLAVILLDFGIATAVIRWENPSDRDLSTLFWLNIINGLLFEGLVVLASPAIAAFYDQPVLVVLAPIAGLSFVLSFGAVHQALLSRALRFRTVSVIAALGSVVGSVTTLVLAVAGTGPFALAVGPAVGSLVGSVCTVAMSRWRPSVVIDRSTLRSVWSFSRGVVGAQAVENALQNADSVLLGRTWGPSVVGLYNRGFTLMLIPVNQVTGALGTVIFPTLARLRNEPGRLLAAYERSAHTIFSVVGLAVTLLGVCAHDVILVLYGERWAGSVGPLQWLCLAGAARVTTLSSAWLLQVVGRTGVMFRLALIEAVLTITGIGIAVQFGATAVAAAVAVAAVIYLPLNLSITYRALRSGPGRLWLRLARSASCLAVAGLAGLTALELLAALPPLARLSITLAIAGSVFLAATMVIDRSLITELRRLLRRTG